MRSLDPLEKVEASSRKERKKKKKVTFPDDGGQGSPDEIFDLLELGDSRAVHVQLQWERPDGRGDGSKLHGRSLRNLWDPLRELIARLKIMKKSPVCLRL